MKDRSQLGAARTTRSPSRLLPLPAEPRRRLRYEIVGLGVFALGLVLLMGAGRQSGLIAPVSYRALSFLIGPAGALVCSFALLGLGSIMVLRWERVEVGRLATGFGLVLWLALASWQLALPGRGVLGLDYGTEPGGLLGLLLAEALRPLFGQVLGIIMLLLGGVCALAYISDTTVISLFTGAAWVLGRLGGAAAALVADVHLPLVGRRQATPQRALPGKKIDPPRPVESKAKEEKKAATERRAPEPKPPVGSPRLQLLDSGAGAETDTPPPSDSEYADFQLPPLDLLAEAPSSTESQQDALASADTLTQALADYGIEAQVVDIERGPRVTRYEIMLPPGVRVSKVTNLADDLAYALKALAVRVEAPVPGKGVIGIEVPNPEVTYVHLREVLESKPAERMKSKIAFALGRDISGHPMLADIATMPHLLIAGATNSGKSVCLNALIASILLRARPDEVKMLLIDPKRVELSLFAGIPHLAAPVAHDAKGAAGLLRWAIREMEVRYSQFADVGVRNIKGWNERAAMDEDMEPMYYLVIVIDELADLMMQAATEFETSICRLAQLARATGIHLVVATQRPS
ncbi:MAG: DNA translocase FtsK, partial [Armatimonadetes bacterium]|nr:DNA translocase FtsK [Armatimonadota bacterium]